MKSAAPSETSRWVRSPASRSRISRSTPIAAPSTPRGRPAARARPSESSGRHELRRPRAGRRRSPRSRARPARAARRAGRGERRPLGGRLHLDQAPAAGHDDVDVDVCGRVLDVVEVEQRLSRRRSRATRPRPNRRASSPDPTGRARAGRRRRRPRSPHSACRRRPAGRRSRARASARRAPRCRHGAQRPPDQALDLDRAALLLARARLALGALAGRGGQHRVLGSQPAPARAVHPARHALVERGRAENAGLPERDQRRAVRLLEEVGLDLERTELVRAAAVGAAHAAPLPARRRHALDLAQRQLQEALAEGAEALGVAGGEETGRRLRVPGRSRCPCARASRRLPARSPRPRRRASRRARRRAGRPAGSAGSACSRG